MECDLDAINAKTRLRIKKLKKETKQIEIRLIKLRSEISHKSDMDKLIDIIDGSRYQIKSKNRKCIICGIDKSEHYFENSSMRCSDCLDKLDSIRQEKIESGHFLKYRKEYRLNPDYKKRRNEQLRLRRKTDPLFRVKINLRGRIRDVLRKNGLQKKNRTFEILGCDFETLKQWLENKFQAGMTWANVGSWHIDHKKPLASAKTEEELIALFHYTNLQPLWAIDNLRKGAKY